MNSVTAFPQWLVTGANPLFFNQRLSVALQKGNAACIIGTMPTEPQDWWYQIEVFFIFYFTLILSFFISPLIAGPGVYQKIPLWLLRLGADIIHLPKTSFSPAPGESFHRPSNENEDNKLTRLLSCLARILELASWWPARPWTFHWQFQEQSENFPFFVKFNFVFEFGFTVQHFHSLFLFYIVSFHPCFAVRHNVIFH